MSDDASDRIERSWIENAAAWTRAVRTGAIESRRGATNKAILDAVKRRSPRRVLDVGCGEGWLARSLYGSGVEVVGVDAAAPLIRAASSLGGGTFHVLSYRDLVAKPHAVGGDFDVVVFNFSLLDADIEPLLQTAGDLLSDHGSVVIQTAHPWRARGDEPYQDGWRTETFAGFGGAFEAAMPWYYRTLTTWFDVITGAGLIVTQLTEPGDPSRDEPLSLLLVARRLGS